MKRCAMLAVLAMAFLPFPAQAAKPVILFDEGHGQQFLADRTGDLDLSGLAASLRDAGCEVRSLRGRIDAAALRGISALIISGAFAPIAPGEIEAIGNFVVGGGRLALMLHIAQPVQGLLEQLGLQYSRGPVHESEGVIKGRSLDFAVTRFEPHALTTGLARMSVFGCWALRIVENSTAREIASTGPHAWLDSDRDGVRTSQDLFGVQTLVVAGEVGSGAYVVFGDDAIFQNRFLKEFNAEIGRRLARWLSPPPAPRSPRAPLQHPGPGGVIDL